ncbi:MAG: ubiquitin-like protein Pup [Nitrospirae bacterium]|nr:ubiquitin-like protein Pup [Nitrospirota bacterium]MDA1304223.1 ubiquitin-like protein Pup [Nitrospirota bacterium]
MEKHERQSDSTKDPSVQDDQEVKANPKVIETGKKLQDDIDHLIDEIDEVLEENASEFVKNYVQKGGE